VEKHLFASAEMTAQNPAQAPSLSGFARLLRCGKDLRQFPEVLGCGCEVELVGRAAWSSQSETAVSHRHRRLHLLAGRV
jgi:hypothetical protein